MAVRRLRRDDSSQQGNPSPVIRPVPAPDAHARNGLPGPTEYTYRGAIHDLEAPWPDRVTRRRRRTRTRAAARPRLLLTAAARLDVCEAIDGPGWGDWRELRDQAGLDPWGDAA